MTEHSGHPIDREQEPDTEERHIPFYDPRLDFLAKEITDWRKTRNFETTWDQFAEKIALCHSELSEALEEHRGHETPLIEYYDKDGAPQGIGVELADCIIRILDMCGSYDIPIAAIIQRKMAYNTTRPHKHGKQY